MNPILLPLHLCKFATGNSYYPHLPSRRAHWSVRLRCTITEIRETESIPLPAAPAWCYEVATPTCDNGQCCFNTRRIATCALVVCSSTRNVARLIVARNIVSEFRLRAIRKRHISHPHGNRFRKKPCALRPGAKKIDGMGTSQCVELWVVGRITTSRKHVRSEPGWSSHHGGHL
jgi:hypothetical protein